MADAAADSPSATVRPLWVPAGLNLDALAPELQRGISDIVNPAYQELVLLAQTAIERASGVTFVHLLYLELIE